MSNPVQTAKGSWVTSGTSMTASFSTLPASGDSVIVAITNYAGGYSSPISAVSDNSGAGNTYTKICSIAESSNNVEIEFWWCSSIGSSSGTFTVTATMTSGNKGFLRLIECSGLTAVDQYGTQLTNSATSGTVTASGANSNANDFVLGLCALDYTGSNPSLSDPPNTSYTSIGGVDNGFTNYIQSDLGYKNITATETSSASWTWTGSLNFMGLVASFKAGSGSTVAAKTASISSAIAVAALTALGALAGICISGTSATATLIGLAPISSTVSTATVASANLSGTYALSSSAVSASAASGTLTGTGALDAGATSSTSAVSALSGSAAVSATAVSATSARASTSMPSALSAAAISASTAAGTLSGAGALTGSGISTTLAVGNPSGNAPISATSVSISRANGLLAPPAPSGFLVPSLTGLLLQEALQVLQASGVLNPSALGYFGTYPVTVLWQCATTMRGIVTAQSIASGTYVKPNTPITLTVNEYRPGVVFP